MIDWLPETAIPLPDDMTPSLMVIIDTEEEFDWSKPLARSNRGVKSIAAQAKAQAVFARYNIVPTYVIDHPVASDPEAVAHLRAFIDDGQCEIGAHLHPWVNPPDEEEVSPYNSYPGNLSAALEQDKLSRLTDTIAESFGKRPTVYKAGRYGIGPNTADTLETLGYDVDVSVVPWTDFSADGGPDFSRHDDGLRWFGQSRRLLEIPLSVGFAGLARSAGPTLFPIALSRLATALHVPGILARSGLLERIRLSPENADQAEQRRLAQSLLAQGQKVFSLTYHSPSLEVGHTPYVRNEAELADFIDRIDRFCDLFLNEHGGRPTTPARLFEELSLRNDQMAGA